MKTFHREFGKLAERQVGNTKIQTKRLAKEFRELPQLGLTMGLSGAIFIRYDENRLDIARVMIIGESSSPSLLLDTAASPNSCVCRAFRASRWYSRD